ncbi:hypothetical protein ACSZM9_08840 [Aeromonas hydrophila]|uniref:hypothetical protein n=1 Tax=Aeromonas hydrophila TaxID=644 RepID=UPI003EC8918D
MNNKILITFFVLAAIWNILMVFFGSLIFDLVDYESSLYMFTRGMDYLSSITITIGIIYFIRHHLHNSAEQAGIAEEPFLPARIIAIIFILAALTYPAFFVDKGYFSNSLISSMDLISTEQLNIKLDIKTNEEMISSLEKQINAIKEPSKPISSEDLYILNKELSNAQEQYRFNSKKHGLNEQRYANLKTRLAGLQEQKHFENLYYVMRALCLGALGAILTLLANSSIKSKKLVNYNSLFSEPDYWQSLITNCLAGSIISVVAFALFYTKQISIFDSTIESNSHAPDFWRSTLLCLIAGAFAEKIYDAVSTKVDGYVEQSSSRSNNAIQPPQKSEAADG